MRVQHTVVTLGVALAVTAVLSAAPQGNPEAAKVKNPVAASPESVAAGEKTYQKFCRSCHGKTGGGGLGPSLIDETWDTGSTDGEIFAVIQQGTGSRMEAWDDRINEVETWNLVNYMRTLVAGKTE